MMENELRSLLVQREKIITDTQASCNDIVKDKLLIALNNLTKVEEEFPKIFEVFLNSKIRFSDYYEPSFSAGENIHYFDDNYMGEDKQEQMKCYMLYSLVKNLSPLAIFSTSEEFANFDEILELLNFGNYYDDLVEYSEDLIKKLELERMREEDLENSKMKFLAEENLYKIMFTGFSYDDIKELPKNVRLQVIRKLYSPLATEKVITKSEAVDHTKSLYDFPLQRIQVADDYRIVYIRSGDVTAILGVGLKTGKNIDYTRYDVIARNKKDIYEEIEEFSSGMFPPREQHKNTMQLLSETYEKTTNRK